MLLPRAVRSMLVLAGGLVLPGVGLWRQGKRTIGAIVAGVHLVAVGSICWVLAGGYGRVLHAALSTETLGSALVGLLVWSSALWVSVVGTWREEQYYVARRAGRVGLHATGAALLVAAAVPVVVGVWAVLPQLRMLEESLVEAPVARPKPVQLGGPVREPEVLEPGALGPLVTEDGRFNVLLLGSDGGQGRWGRRMDSVNLVSIEVGTGEAAIVAIPRNLVGVPMPGDLAREFEKGFPGLFNALHTWAASNREKVLRALGPSEEPELSLVAGVVAELTGLRIDGWAMVDMAGFLEIVDALGGVDIHVDKAVPPAGDIAEGKHGVAPMFLRGWQRMDGTDALAYARSREADSDYQRMARQRCVLLSLAAQSRPVELARRWPALMGVVGENLRTNLSAEQIEALVRIDRARVAQTRVLALVPPLLRNGEWSVPQVRALVAQMLGGGGAGGVPNVMGEPRDESTGAPGRAGSAAGSNGAADTKNAQRAGETARCLVQPPERRPGTPGETEDPADGPERGEDS